MGVCMGQTTQAIFRQSRLLFLFVMPCILPFDMMAMLAATVARLPPPSVYFSFDNEAELLWEL